MKNTTEKVEYYVEQGKACILVSPGHSAGWSTWNKPELAYDRRIVERFLQGANEDEMEEFLNSIGYEYVYTGGYEDLEIKRVPVGMSYVIVEEDGHEWIITGDKMAIAGV